MRSALNNLWLRRNLLWVLIASNLKRQNKNSVLGYLWWLLDPILMTVVYYVVVVILFRRGGGSQPYILFVMCGLMAWKAFGDSVGQSVGAIRGQTTIIRAISFPKAVLPLSLVFSNAFHFLVALVVVVGMAWWYADDYGTWPNIYYLMLPVVILLQLLFTIGFVLIIATMGVFFQDIGNIMRHLLRMWFFLTPNLYSIDLVPEQYRALFRVNPFCELITAYRDIIMKGRMPSWFDLGYAFAAGLVCCLVGYFIFRRYEGRFVQRL